MQSLGYAMILLNLFGHFYFALFNTLLLHSLEKQKEACIVYQICTESRKLQTELLTTLTANAIKMTGLCQAEHEKDLINTFSP